MTAILDVYSPDEVEDLLRRASPEHRKVIVPVLLSELHQRNRLKLQPKQELAEELSNKCDALLFGGAAGGGKTFWLIAHAAKQLIDYPGNRGAIFRRVYPSLERSIIPRARAFLAPWAKYNESKHFFTFHNGSILELGALQYAADVDAYQGAEYGFVAFEEVTEFLESQVDYFKTRLRAPVPGVHPHMIATTNPGGVGHRWVKREWVRPKPEDVAEGSATPEPYKIWTAAPKADEKPMTRCFIPATLEDNPELLKRDPSYRDRLRSIKKASLRKAMEKGDWDAIEAVEGALWAGDQIDHGRLPTYDMGQLAKIIVGVDPSGGTADGNDQQGIVAVGKGYNGHGYVLADRSCKLSPAGWGKRAVQCALDLNAEEIVVEKNYGGDMAIEVIRNAMRALEVPAKAIKVEAVTASRGKKVRAEPIAALYGDPEDQSTWDQAEMHHVGEFEELEAEMTTWLPESGESPNHMDANVWAATRAFGLTKERPKLVCV